MTDRLDEKGADCTGAVLDDIVNIVGELRGCVNDDEKKWGVVMLVLDAIIDLVSVCASE